ncbi:hypothetical protein [Microbacterium sp.]|uniref:hypothetical protein n=1 Tax=Microbacterium sp. TaxID=51671 RepID=UPI003A8CE187
MVTTKLIAVVSFALLLTGCSAGASAEDSALGACVSAAEDEVGASIDASGLKAGNMDDALYEAGITDDKKTDDSDALFTVAGDFTYEKDGTQSRRSMICSVKYTDGKAGDPELTVIGGN